MSRQLDLYVKAAIPTPYTVFGVTLRPLSLGSLVLMNRFGCAFGSDDPDAKASFWDIFIAVAICCRKYNEFLEWYADEKERNKWLNRWFKSIEKDVKRDRSWSLFSKYTLFNSYRKEGIDSPYYFDCSEDKDETESGAHWIQNVSCFLISEGYEEIEVLDMPLSKALNIYYKLLENKGRINLMKDWEIEESEKLNMKKESNG